MELELDLDLVVGFVCTEISNVHPLVFMVCLCQGFLSKDWLLWVAHV